MALRSAAFVEATDPRFQRLFTEEYNRPADLVPKLYFMAKTTKQPTERFGSIGTLGLVPKFTGTVSYEELAPGYNALITPLVFIKGIQIERELIDDDQHGQVDALPKQLGRVAALTRANYALRPFNNATSVDSFFYTNSESIPWASASHTTRKTNVSTTSGFSNLATSAFSAVALESARIQMKGFKDDAGNLIDPQPDTLIYAPFNYARVEEVIKSEKKTLTNLNDINVHQGGYETIESAYLTSTANWGLVDRNAMTSGDGLLWVDRDAAEMEFVEDFETTLGKWRVRFRFGQGHRNWRWGLWANVS